MPQVTQSKEEEIHVKTQLEFKPRLYSYPNFGVGLGVFEEEEELTDEAFVIVCQRKNEEEGIDSDIAYLWKGYNFDPADIKEEGDKIAKNEQEFKEKVLREYWGPDFANVDIQEREEEVGEESEDFLCYFD